MGLVETEGLVLRTYPLSDADKIFVALTKDDGLVRGVAKGAKRMKSRFGSGLEPFTVVHLSYFRKDERELVTLSHTELVTSYFSIASEPAFLGTFSQAAELLQAFAPPHDPNERLYNMTKVCLEAAADDPESLEPVYAYFRIWLLKLGGFLPQWDRCAECSVEISQADRAALQSDFGVLCGNCRGRGRIRELMAGERDLYRYAQRTSPGKFKEAAASTPEGLDGLSEILGRMIARILNKEIEPGKAIRNTTV